MNSKQGLRNSSARKKTFGSSSNRKNLSNAIMSVLLAGTTNDLQRMDVLSILAKSQHSNFVILFKNTGRQTFQGLYAFDEEGDVVKLYGLDRLPATIADHQVATYYKYSSGSKQFTPIPGNKALSIAVDAVELKQVGPSKK